MIAMPPHALTAEHGREAQALWHLLLRNMFVTALWLSDNEFTELEKEKNGVSCVKEVA